MDPDSLLHAHHKILLDTLRHPNQTPANNDAAQVPPPPAYSPTAPLPHPNHLTPPRNTNNTVFENENDDDDDLLLTPQPPITIKIDGTTKVVGHGNVLAYSPSETATRVAAMLVAALRQTKVLEGGEPRPVEISVGAGVSVVGCRNVVGATGVKGKGAEKGADGEARGMKEGVEGSGGGRKRGVEEDSAEMPRAKKAEMSDG